MAAIILKALITVVLFNTMFFVLMNFVTKINVRDGIYFTVFAILGFLFFFGMVVTVFFQVRRSLGHR